MTGSVFFTTKTNEFCLTMISYSTLPKFFKTIHFLSSLNRSPKLRTQAEIIARRINLHSWFSWVTVNNTLTVQWLLFQFQLYHLIKMLFHDVFTYVICNYKYISARMLQNSSCRAWYSYIGCKNHILFVSNAALNINP